MAASSVMPLMMMKESIVGSCSAAREQAFDVGIFVVEYGLA